MEQMEQPTLLMGSNSMSPVSDETFERALNHRERQEPREGIECEKCGNHEFTWVVRDGERYYRPCGCKVRRDSIRRIRKSGLGDQISRCTFAGFETAEPWQREIKTAVERFVHDKDRGWLLLSGQSGAGKSHLCTAAAGAFIRAGADTRYMRWLDESTALKALVNDDEGYFRRLNPFKTCKVLYIDDFFKTQHGAQPTAADVKLAFDLLDYRYCTRSLVTMISTERTIDELLDIDEALGGRIYERTRGNCIVIAPGAGKNWRLRHG